MRTIACAGLLLCGIVLAAPAPKDVKVPDYFPVKEGAQWTYAQSSMSKTAKIATKNTTVMTIEKVETEKDLTKIKVGNTLGKSVTVRAETFEINGKEIICRESNMIPYDLVIYKKGAKPGDKWEGKVSYNKIREGKAESVVEESEEITVPAGKYKCVVVSHKIEVDPAGKGINVGRKTQITLKFWLAEGVGIVKRERVYSPSPATMTTLIYELEEYLPKKKAD